MRPRLSWSTLAAALATGVPPGAATSAGVGGDPRLEAVSRVARPGLTLTEIAMVPAGTFAPTNGMPPQPGLPDFCRVCALARTAPDSHLRIEVWMPRDHWNGRFIGTGNSGGAGRIIYNTLASGLQLGFAIANTDLGTSPDPEDVLDHPDRWADFGRRGTHEMTLVAKAIVQAYYGQPAHRAYFVGGSTGGQQALVEAQRYPDDYDGILAGAPGNNRTHLHAMFLWNWAALHAGPGSALTPAQVALVSRAVVQSRDAHDGGAPGDDFLTDPRMCAFDPAQLLAPDGAVADENHLARAQVAALRKIYAGPVNPRTGERIYAPPPPGSERTLGLTLPDDPSAPPPHSYLFRWAFGAGFDYRRFDFDRDLDALDAQLAPILNANHPDLAGVRRHGGKILMYSGTADAITPFADALNYYERVIQSQGGLAQTQEFFRYFVVPGLGHVAGGPGLNDFGQRLILDVPADSDHDALQALVKWVEHGVAPDRIIATAFHGGDPANGIRFQRPIYPYPKFPHYMGGDVNAPASYEGVDHPRGTVFPPAGRYLN